MGSAGRRAAGQDGFMAAVVLLSKHHRCNRNVTGKRAACCYNKAGPRSVWSNGPSAKRELQAPPRQPWGALLLAVMASLNF